MRTALRYAPLALGLALAVGWFLFLRPAQLGGPMTYTIVSGHSMDPTLATNDLLALRAQDEYEIGDVVTYRVPVGDPGAGHVIVHRIIGGNGTDGFITQGDNNPRPDLWKPTQEDVLGRLTVQVPHAGDVLMLVRSPLVVAMVGAFFGAFMVLGRPRRERPVKEAAPA
jgi:signal peptidase I